MTTLGNVSTKTLDKVPGFPHDGLTINGVKQKSEVQKIIVEKWAA